MKNLKSTLLVLASVSALALAGCRSGDDTASPVTPGALTIEMTKTVGANSSGGVSSSPGGLSCDSSCPAGTYTQTFPAGTVVTLTATPGANSMFNGWSGSTNCGIDPVCRVSGSGRIALTASFVNSTSGSGDTFLLMEPSDGAPLGELVSFNYSTPSVQRTRRTISAVTADGFAAGEKIVSIDFRPSTGRLYALSVLGTKGRVFEVNPDTGAVVTSTIKTLKNAAASDTVGSEIPDAAEVNNASLSGTRYGIDFNPFVESQNVKNLTKIATLRIVSDAGQNLRVNVDTGATVADTTLGDNGATATGIVESAYTNNYLNAKGTVLYVVSATTGKLYIQNTPGTGPSGGTLYEVGSLGLPANVSGMAGFDIRGSGSSTDGAQYAVFAASANGANSLYSIDLATGAAQTIAGPISATTADTTNPLRGKIAGLSVRNFAAASTVSSDAFALTSNGRLIGVTRTDARTLITQNAIAFTPGLDGGKLMDIDVRPQDGELYGLTNNGKLYRISQNSGLAIQTATLNTAISGDHYGIDFDPRSDTLRVVTDNGKSYAVQINGNVIANTDLKRSAASASATGAAYTHSLAGAANSTLFDLDAVERGGQRKLAVENTNSTSSSNAGVGQLTNVGNLGVVPDDDIARGFDIDAATGLAYAVFKVGGNVGLYKINLSNGNALGTVSASQPATTADSIGPVGALDVVGFALRQHFAIAYGLTAANKLIAFNPSAPGTLLLNKTISVNGASLAELRTLDYRPSASDNSLYSVTTTGKLCSATLADVNSTTSSVVAFRCTKALSQSSSDNAAPYYTGFDSTATEYASSFYPKKRIADAETSTSLRIINDKGQDVIASVATGFADADPALLVTNTGTLLATNSCDVSDETVSPAVGAIAYSTLISDATEPDLFALSSPSATTTCTYKVNTSTGKLTSVGRLGPVSTTVMGFDIAGADNALPIAALDTGDASRSVLYNINVGSALSLPSGVTPPPSNGSATTVPNVADARIGADGLGKIRALTIYLLPPQ